MTQEYSPHPHSPIGLETHGLVNLKTVRWNLPTPALYEQAVKRNEGLVGHQGPLVVRTGMYTGRSPNDKFVVEEPSSRDHIWWGPANRPIAEDRFAELHRRMDSYLQGKDIYVQDLWCGADPEHRMPIRIITQYAWHSLFARNLFIQPSPPELAVHEPQFVVIDAPGFRAYPELDRTNSDVFILVNFAKRMVLIGGTEYAGEIKKSIFTAMNYYLPFENILSMHCSANYGPDDDVALFFGLSGTGKTTLSADATRTLIGDDEHGWGDNGIFNFEGGCYAKVIRLSQKDEPEIFAASRRFGTVLENVGIDTNTRRMDLNDDSLTENTRAAYPISHLHNATRSGRGSHPRNIIFLTADAFGVLPPISRLTPEQALYHFISGYTAKVAGTERGVTEPKATFSACFGAPFMAQHPNIYSGLLGNKISEHNVTCWLINTGWTGGPYGVGGRIKLSYTRAMVNAALNGELEGVEYTRDLLFGLQIPVQCPGVPDEVLRPRETWGDKSAYDSQARQLASMFVENFKRFESEVSKAIQEAGPHLEMV